MFTVSVKDDIKQALRKLDNFSPRQIPFVVAKALTNTAQNSKKDLIDVMPRVFDRPTPYTLNSLYVKPATKQSLEAIVKLKDDTYKGTPASKYLGPQIFGGNRNIKRFERLLTGRGILPAGMAVMPAAGAELDQYGNMKRGQFSKILSQLQANTDFYQNETAASRKRKGRKVTSRYFVGAPGGGKLPLGIYARYGFAQGSAIKPVMLFVEVPKYRNRFDFQGIVVSTIKRKFSDNLTEAMQFALNTSR